MKKLTFVALCLFLQHSFAFQCFITAMKGDCWKNFDVKISVSDNVTQEKLVDNLVLKKNISGKGGQWARIKFDCQARGALRFSASYSPAIWKKNKGKIYYGKRIWFLPASTKNKDVTAWNVPLCFAHNFSSVPLPTTASDRCDCKAIAKTVPAVPPQ